MRIRHRQRREEEHEAVGYLDAFGVGNSAAYVIRYDQDRYQLKSLLDYEPVPTEQWEDVTKDITFGSGLVRLWHDTPDACTEVCAAKGYRLVAERLWRRKPCDEAFAHLGFEPVDALRVERKRGEGYTRD